MKWLKREKCKRPKLSGEALEPDGAWTRVAGGNVDLKIERSCGGVCGKLGRRGYGGARSGSGGAPRRIVSDGDRAIEVAIDMAYDRDTPHQLCQFRLLRFTRCVNTSAT